MKDLQNGLTMENELNAAYEIIYTDPPWPQRKGGIRKSRPLQERELDYKTMSIDDMFMLHKTFFAQTAERHNVFMWAIDKFLPEAEKQMDQIGYKLHARIIWDKCNGVAPAFTVRFSHEYLLWFYKPGLMLMPEKSMRGKYMDVIREPSTIHSKKPVAAYEMLENMFPNAKKIELFARNRRIGWDSFGDQLDEVTLKEQGGQK